MKIAGSIRNKNGDMKDIYQNLLNDVSKRVYNTFNRYFSDILKGNNPGYPDSNPRTVMIHSHIRI